MLAAEMELEPLRERLEAEPEADRKALRERVALLRPGQEGEPKLKRSWPTADGARCASWSWRRATFARSREWMRRG